MSGTGSPQRSAAQLREQAIGAIERLAPEFRSLGVGEAAAMALFARGHNHAAETVFRAMIAERPRHLGALRGLAQVLRITGRGEDCARARAAVLEAESAQLGLASADQQAALHFLMAAEGAGPAPASAPPGYVARRFDLFEDYDLHLRGRLAYRGPELLAAGVEGMPPLEPAPWIIVDAGCGTGLVGAAMRSQARELIGIDLAPAMVGRARALGIYDQLLVGDAIATLAELACSGRFVDLVLAGDMLPYLGDCAPLFAAARTILRPGGVIACTAEAADDAGGNGPGDRAVAEEAEAAQAAEETDAHQPGWCLRGSRRYAHTGRYLAGAAAEAGFGPVTLQREVVRSENGRPVAGLVLMARLAGAGAGA